MKYVYQLFQVIEQLKCTLRYHVYIKKYEMLFMSIIRFVSIKLIFSGFEDFLFLIFLSTINYPTVVTAFMTEINITLNHRQYLRR